MHTRTSLKKLSIFVLMAAFLVVFALSSRRARVQTRPASGSVKAITVHAAGRETLLNLKDGYEMGTRPGQDASGQQPGDPVALASADFDEDGIADLVTGYRGGELSVYRGNADAIYSNSREAQVRKRNGQFNEDAFLPRTLALEVPETPDLLLTGDFNADGHSDIAATTYNSSSIYLLAGNGHGKFQATEPIKIKGAVTTAATGQIGRADNLTDLAVGVVNDTGAQLLIYEHPEGAFKHAPEVFNLPAPATAIVLGHFDEDSLFDVAVACGNKLVIVHGHMQIYPWDLSPSLHLKRPPAQIGQRELEYEIAGLAAGHFSNSRRESLALLSTDGSLHLLEPPSPRRSRHTSSLAAEAYVDVSVPSDGQFPAYKTLTAAAPQFSSTEEAEKAGYSVTDGKQDPKQALKAMFKTSEQQPASKESTRVQPQVKTSKLPQSFYTAASRIREWHDSLLTSEASLALAAHTGAGDLMTKARVSNTQTDDLIVLNKSDNKIQIVSTRLPDEKQSGPGASTTATGITTVTSLDVEGKPVAILPMRLNADALTDLVVMRSGSVSLSVIMTTPATTFTVNSSADDVVSNCTDAVATCTLRDALNRANNNPGSIIAFNIPGGGVHTISPFTELPVVGQPVTIDGTTQPGYGGSPVIEIKGDNFPSNHGVDGLKIRASNCVVRGLAINQFPHAFVGGVFIGGNGLTLESLSNQNNGNNLVEGNFLGIDPGGTTAQGNAAANLNIFDSDNNTVGGKSAQARNVMSGDGVLDTGFGIQLLGNNNLVEGNYIGTDATGNQSLANSRGMLLLGSNNLIGGDAVGAGNVISGNGVLVPNTSQCAGGGISEGLLFSESDPDTNLTLNNLIKGNKIGTNASGTARLGNCYAGIGTLTPTQLIIGSITSGGRNIISNNGYTAIDIEKGGPDGGFTAISGDNIGTDITGTVAMPNNLGNQPGGFNVAYAVITIRPNAGSFVNVGSPGGTSPGGSCTGFCTLVSGNFDNNNGTLAAVYRAGGGEFGIFSSFVGTDISGTVALPNYDGVIANGETSYIGFPGIASGNLISGNQILAVALEPSFGFKAYLAGNLIGTDTTGNNALPNNSDPLPFSAVVHADGFFGPGGVVIGGSNPLDRNIISGNILGALEVSGNVVVQNNFIGVNLNGAALPNTGDGITSDGFVQIGGAGAGEANTVSNNGKNGILVKSGNADIRGNTISNNGKVGVSVIGGGSSATIRQNVIANNGDLGIDLGGDGVTQNDCDDSDEGPNGLQNYPLLSTPADQGGGMVKSHGTIKSTPHITFTIDFYTNAAADPSNYGEGETYGGNVVVTTGPYGIAEFDSPNVAAGQVITATATNQDGQTSEFSCGAGLCQQDAINRFRESPEVIGCVDPIIVNTTGDQDDGDPNDGVCDVDPNQTGNQCTLRAAIEEANLRGGGAFVAFDIPGGGVQTISPATALPTITAKVRIDATTQNGYVDSPVIQLDGTNAGADVNGFTLGANNIRLRGFVINNFNGNGILLQSVAQADIESCYIGTDPTGNLTRSNGLNGIKLQSSSNNRIGGTNTIDRNIIAENGSRNVSGEYSGVHIDGNSPSNTVIGNYIGTLASGTSQYNSDYVQSVGILINSSNNIVGGATTTTGTAPGNVISGNRGIGVAIVSVTSVNANNNVVAGNIIGATPDGTEQNSNNVGVGLSDNANNNTVGGASPALRNLISGNTTEGVLILSEPGNSATNNHIQGNFIGTDLGGNSELRNGNGGVFIQDSPSNTVGGSTSGAGNVISGNDVGVIIENSAPAIDEAHDNTISGNYIGVGKDGKPPVFNKTAGVLLAQNARNNTIGGLSAAARNVISGNSGDLNHRNSNGAAVGITLNLGSHDNQILGNYIGTDSTGHSGVPNRAGIVVGANGNFIGGTSAGSRNIISGNDGLGGIFITNTSSTSATTSNNQVLGNYVGTDVTGANAIPNSPYGIGIFDGATNNFVGSNTASARNIISGNSAGIVIGESGLVSGNTRTIPPSGNMVQNNFIGTDATGVSALPNTGYGIWLIGSNGSTIGGTSAALHNVISGNQLDGVKISDVDSTLNLIQGNYIGTQNNGAAPLGNTLSGVLLDGGAHHNTIGGTAAGAGNAIMFNGKNGVSLDASAGTGNIIDPNSISANSILGISLNDDSETPTANDPGDGDSGPNNLQNFPEFSSAIINGGGNLVLQFKIDSAPANTNYGDEGLYVEIFKADESLQGKTFIGSTNYALTNYNNGTPGLATLTLPDAAGLDIHVGDKLVATATDADGNTSEFTSTNVGIVAAPTAATALISGKISTTDGMALGGVVVTLNGSQTRRSITDSNGNYRFENVETGGFYSVTPLRANYSFNPANRSFSILGSKTDAAFTAVANQSENANPLDTTEFFVRQQYLDFLGREPDSGGFNYWTGVIEQCGTDMACAGRQRVGVSAAFFAEQEFQDSGLYIYDLYQAALGRKPRYIEFSVDRRNVVGGPHLEADKTAFAASFVERLEFTTRYPLTMTADAFVDALLQTAQQSSGLDFNDTRADLMSIYTNGATMTERRSLVLRHLVVAAGFKQSQYNAAFVLTEYFGYLVRNPDRSGYDFWLNILNEGDRNNYRGMVCSFITSAEYQRRFSTVVTRSNTECGP